VTLEDGTMLQGDIPDTTIATIKGLLRQHEMVIDGGDPNHASFRHMSMKNHEETRHTGTSDGGMKLVHRKIAKDVEKKGLRFCARPECKQIEGASRQFAVCSRCKWKAYCSRECQKMDWKRHKGEDCSNEKTAKEKEEYKEQRKGNETLMPGQIQQFMTVVTYLHSYFLNSPEFKALPEAQFLAASLPKINGPEDYQKINIQQVGIIWNSFWNMNADTRGPMLHRFVKEMDSAGFQSISKGGPPFSVTLEWNHCYKRSTFVAAQNTSFGTIFMHEKHDGEIVAYQVKGISQSIKSLLDQIKIPLPLSVSTTLIGFKGVIVTDGTIAQGSFVSPRLQKAADTFISSGTQLKIITTLSM